MIHRSDLHALLRALLPAGTVSYEQPFVRFEQNEANVTAYFENGASETADLLIGADGLHSAVREALFGPTPLRYAGFTAFRGICRFPETRIAREIGDGFEAWGPGVRFGATPIGRGRIFWFAAHPMLPNLGQGGAQALEDALVLAHSLSGANLEVPQALAAYERSRLPRTTRVVRDSRRMGRLVQMEHPAAIAIRNRLLRTIPARFQLRRHDVLR